MENKDVFLIGNHIIGEAIAKFKEDQSDENFYGVLIALRQRMNEDGHLILPIEFNKENPEQFIWQALELEEGSFAYVAFTSEEEMEKAPQGTKMSYDIEGAFNVSLMEGDEAAGIVINPYTDNFFISKPGVSTIFQLNQFYGDDRPLHLMYAKLEESGFEERVDFEGEDTTNINAACMNALDGMRAKEVPAVALVAIEPTGDMTLPEAAFEMCNAILAWRAVNSDYPITVYMVADKPEVWQNYDAAMKTILANMHAEAYEKGEK